MDTLQLFVRFIKLHAHGFFEQIVKIACTAYFISKFLPSGLEYACFCLILGDVISEILSFILSYALYKWDLHHLNTNSHRLVKKSYTTEILKISVPVAITSYIRSGLSTLKQLLIPSSLEKNGMSCSASFSTYGTVFGMAMPVVMFPSLVVSSFSSLLVPEFARYRAKRDNKRALEVIKIIYLVTSSFAIIFNILFFLFSKEIALFFYHSEDAVFYIKAFSFLTVFMYLDIAIDSILKGLNAQVSVMLINILDLLLTVTLIYILVPYFGTIRSYNFCICK